MRSLVWLRWFTRAGPGGLDLLREAKHHGAHVACIHPLQTFADVESAILKIPGSTFGITADAEILPWADRIVEDLGGRPFHVSSEDKALYHAAACIASNYLVTLMYLVEEIYGRMGLSREEAIRALAPGEGHDRQPGKQGAPSPR